MACGSLLSQSLNSGVVDFWDPQATELQTPLCLFFWIIVLFCLGRLLLGRSSCVTV